MTSHAARYARSLLLACLILALTLPAFAGETRYGQTLADGCRCELVFAASPLQTMTEIPFAITLNETSGLSRSDATLAVSLDMTAMPMPPNRPATRWSEGAYRGTAIFTMAGAWQVRVRIERPGASPADVVFDIPEVRM